MQKNRKKIIISLITAIIAAFLLVSCDRGCANCNADGTPMPTLESEVLEGLQP